jgi:hypothetical protein
MALSHPPSPTPTLHWHCVQSKCLLSALLGQRLHRSPRDRLGAGKGLDGADIATMGDGRLGSVGMTRKSHLQRITTGSPGATGACGWGWPASHGYLSQGAHEAEQAGQ